jgi:hypothetical protein
MFASAIAALTLMPFARLIAIEPDLSFPQPGAEEVHTFGPLHPGLPFNEAIVSWNVKDPATAALKISVVAEVNGHRTVPYVLADWAGDAGLHPRQSVPNETDKDGAVLTDTLHLNATAESLTITVTLKHLAAAGAPKLELLVASFSNTGAKEPDHEERSAVWGKVLPVPERAQGNYPNGGVLCSPTSVSMVLKHYSQLLKRPELDRDVPEVEAGVWDSVYKGAGNWPFNTAYAGGFAGLRAYVARLESVADLEAWIAAGFPVICSVSFDMLQGKPLSPQESGHLVVLAGFTKDGDPIFNDPAWREHVRTTYKRSDFVKAWDYGHRTVYLIYPADAHVPADPKGLWMDR